MIKRFALLLLVFSIYVVSISAQSTRKQPGQKAAPSEGPSAEERLEAWQKDWDKFIDEYNSGCTRDANCESQRFAGKRVFWQGKIEKIEPLKSNADETWRIMVKIGVNPRLITGEDGAPPQGAVNAEQRDILLQPENPEAAAKWKEAVVGDRVSFRATVDARGPVLYSRIGERLLILTSFKRPELLEIIKAK
jgi:hypothetical protein